jgi:hypothetical protein
VSQVWFNCSYDNIQAYGTALISYFLDWSDRTGDSTKTVSFIRRSIFSSPYWNNAETICQLPEVTVKVKGSIGDLETNALEVDFANVDPCFGPGTL